MAHLTVDELSHRIAAARRLRVKILPDGTSAFRLINSSGDHLPGLYADIYGEYAVVQIESPSISAIKGRVAECLAGQLGLSGVYEKSYTPRSRMAKCGAEGVLIGRVPQQIRCTERSMELLVHPSMAKTGYFVDLRETRRFLEERSKGAVVLDCYAFTCSMGLFTRRGGATRVVHVEKRPEPLALGKEMYRLNGYSVDESCFVEADVEDFLQREVRSGNVYDIVILDPPEFAAAKAEAVEARERYRRINTLAAKLVGHAGILVTSCCSHAVRPSEFDAIIAKVRRRHSRESRCIWSTHSPDDHPTSDTDPWLHYLRVLGLLFGKPRSSRELSRLDGLGKRNEIPEG